VNLARLAPPRPVFFQTLFTGQAARVSAVALAVLLAWDLSGLDMPVARWLGGAEAFPLRDTWLMEVVLHRYMRNLGWLLLGLLAIGSFRPRGFMRSLPRRERVQLPLAVLSCLGAVTLLKFWSDTSCPWDLHAFGGTLAHVSHWRPGAHDGGGGHCFPAGHASTGFAFVGGYFALRRHRPRLAAWWLGAALAAGAGLGLSQQLRGAHFTSHTLWTAWICWTLGAAVDAAFRCHAASADTQGNPLR